MTEPMLEHDLQKVIEVPVVENVDSNSTTVTIAVFNPEVYNTLNLEYDENFEFYLDEFEDGEEYFDDGDYDHV